MPDHSPRLSRHVVARQRLLARLDACPSLTVVRAPVGFGKTTLLAQWVADRTSGDELTAWIHVRPGAGDATTFWDTVRRVLADCGLPAVPRAPGTEPVPDLVERALAAVDRPVLLVLDNFEQLSAPSVEQRLLDVLRYAPRLRLIAAGRGHRRLAPREFVDFDPVSITPQELLFTVEETARLCAATGMRLPPEVAESIQQATGGWPGLTRAAVLALRESGGEHAADPSRAAHHVASEYLRSRLLDDEHQPALTDFVLATSVPDEFTADSAEALTGDEQAKLHLDQLEHDGLLLRRLRNDTQVYCWPSAALRVLRTELRRRSPARVRQLRTKLARYHLANDEPGDALHHAVRAGDWPQATRVIETSARTLLFAHRDEELYEALLAAPIEILASSPTALALRDTRLPVPPELLLAAARLPASPAALVRASRWTEIARTLEAGFMMQIALRRRGLIEHAREYADRILALAERARSIRPGEFAELYPSLQLQAGVTCMIDGDHASALERLTAAYDYGPDNPKAYLQADAAGKLALIHAMGGEITTASRWLHRHDRAPLDQTWLAPMIRSCATAARLLLALDGHDDAAAAAAHDGLLAPALDDELWAYLVHAQAQYGLHRHAPADALGLLDRARDRFRARLGRGAVAGPLLAAAEADLLLALGRANQAHAVLGGEHAEHPLLRVGQARLDLLTGEDAAALRRSADTSWDRGATARQRLQMRLVRAVAAHRTGASAVAEDALRQAVHAARAGGSLRAFTTVPRDALHEIAQHVPAAAALLDSPALHAAPELFPTHLTLISLTTREQLVLEKLDEGLSTRQIADTLVVSVNTIKTQLRSLYRKLGTGSRQHALALARQWGLLPGAPAIRR